MSTNVSPNVVGYVKEFVEDKDPETLKTQFKFKLQVRNTMGQELTLFVYAPEYLSDFFASDTREAT